jgi:hypothetical protein
MAPLARTPRAPFTGAPTGTEIAVREFAFAPGCPTQSRRTGARTKKHLAVTILLAALLPARAQADAARVVKMAFGTGIENHTITGVDTSFSADCGRLYFWTVTAGPMEADTIFHTWSLNGREIQKLPILVRGHFYRSHSYKTVSATLSGSWKVAVSDAKGNLLAADSATVRAAATPEE